jgi:hypothetical protein
MAPPPSLPRKNQPNTARFRIFIRMKIKGIITHVPLSGGFWGIEADNGRKYRPVQPLEADFQTVGLHIEAEVAPSSGFSIFMWGTDVEVISMRKSTPKP